MKNNILRKRFSMNCMFVFIGINLLFSFNTPCSAQENKAEETYKTFIKQADNAFAAQDYEKALKLYEKANQSKPDYNYPTDKIEEIKKILATGTDPKTSSAQVTNSNAGYKTLIKQADYSLDNEDYAGALLLFDKAFQIKPDYNYAPGKINEINLKLNETPELKTQIFDNTISKAEKLYEQKNYPQAKSEYQKASLIDSSAQLPKDRLNQISFVYFDTNDLGNFNLDIANGDKELSISDFDHAIMYYEAALKVHPNAKYVSKKIADAKNQQLAYNAKAKQSTMDVVSNDKVSQSEKPADATRPAEMIKPGKTGESQLLQEQNKYDAALATAENSLKSANYEAALTGFKSALAIRPAENYPKTRINEIEKLLAEKTSRKNAYDLDIKNGDQALSEKNYDVAMSHYSDALLLLPGEKYPAQKAEEISAIIQKQKETDENYSKSIAEADTKFNENKFEDAISLYNKALGFKPVETYPQQKISEAQVKLSLLKSKDAEYATAIASGDQFLSASKYNEALSAYKQALSIKPNEAYPVAKTAEINSILAKQKSDSENYAQAIRTGEKSLAAGNLSLALTSFQDAQKIKPSELYPVEQISEIKALMVAQQNKEEKYNNALKRADQLFAEKEYNGALTSYTEASEIKKNEKYPQDQIAKINKIKEDSRSVNDKYNLAVNEGDKLLSEKDYSGAISAFTKATAIKPTEAYPQQRISEINKIMEEITLARSSEYNKALEIADKLYNTKVFDQAIDAYESAAKINPGDAYPEQQIGKIRKYMSDHAILDLNSQSLVISNGNEKIFTFSAIDPGSRKNNYILLKARSTSSIVPKVYLNYGKDNTKNGGIVLRNLDKSSISDFLISISTQDKWFREDNNWISLSVETGSIEITKVQIAAGE